MTSIRRRTVGLVLSLTRPLRGKAPALEDVVAFIRKQ